LLSSGCRDEAHARIEEYLAANPDDPDGLYVLARFTWVTRGTAAAETLINDMIANRPDFLSARVLLAGMRVGQRRFDEAQQLLDDVEPVMSNDVWILVNRLRLEAMLSPSDEIRETLLAVLTTPEFPPNVRITAADQVWHTAYATQAQVETALRVPLDIDTGDNLDCKLMRYANWMDAEGHLDEAREVLERYFVPGEECRGLVHTRQMLAYANLAAAADVAPYPTAGNAAFLARADELLDGDYLDLANWLIGRPREADLRPFILPKLEVDAVDAAGVTRLCHAVVRLNVEAVRVELERGADPNIECSGDPPAEYIRHIATREKVAERQAVLQLLLENGATVGDVRGCASPSEGDCASVLLPIYQAFGFGR